MKIEQNDTGFLLKLDSQEILAQENWQVLRFQVLARHWQTESRFLSFARQMARLPSYQAIIEMGEEALPFIFAEMQKQPGHWFIALRQITGENPVRPEHKGDLQKMTADWLEWAKEKEII